MTNFEKYKDEILKIGDESNDTICESYPTCEECRRDYWLQEVE